MKETYEEAENVMKADKLTEYSWATEGIEQGCQVNPTLTTDISEMEEGYRKGQDRGKF